MHLSTQSCPAREDADSRSFAIAKESRREPDVAQRLRSERRHQPESLSGVTPQIHDELQYFSTLDVLSDGGNAKYLAQRYDCLEQPLTVSTVLCCSYEPSIELDLIELQFSQVSDRGEAGAEIVQHNSGPGTPELRKVRTCSLKIREESSFRHLNL